MYASHSFSNVSKANLKSDVKELKEMTDKCLLLF